MTAERAAAAIRLADIAAHAGVSEATVSRVLNGKPGVGGDTRQVVLAAMDVLGYERPVRTRQRSAGLIGLVIPELDNPIFPAYAQAIETLLTRHGYTPIFCTLTPGGATEDEYVEMLMERGVSGIVFVSGLHADTTADSDRYQRLVDRRLPLVFINGHRPEIPATFFAPDDRHAARLAISYLAELGHERIGLAAGPARFVPVVRKVEGFLAASQALLGLDAAAARERISHTFFSVAGGQTAARQLLERGCTAAICGSDMMALGAIRALRDEGLSVPQDFSVIGYDDSPLIAFTDPPLTTVRQPVQAIAQAAVGTLLEELSGLDGPKDEFVFAPELVVRGSTAAAPR
ncbi:MAG TPA: LacI family DNA-binding transcriptional regulator [Actinocrinis sp.]|nr:LacI family DNA-binding transcriptional regulator [Actinocrinis sp.]